MLTLAALPAVAQSVRGRLLDVELGQPLAGARLLLLNANSEAVDSAVSDQAGSFRLRAPSAGSYMIYFDKDGWAAVPSDQLHLAHGVTTDFEFRVPLVSDAEVRRISEIITAEGRLQRPLTELCGEPVRAWEAGLLVGVVRERGTDRPVAGARIAVADASATRATVTSERGIYVLCNVLASPAVRIVVTSPPGLADTTRVEVRAGTVGWYDLEVRTRRQPPRSTER